MQGIDISCYQRDIKLREGAGCDFVILKISEGRTIADDKFNDFFNQAKACGLKVGGYVLSHADSEQRARDEVRFALSVLGGRELPLGLYIDIEANEIMSLPNEMFKKVVNAFVLDVEKNGYVSGIYSSELTGWAKIKPSDFPRSISWVAQYTRKPSFACDLWQKTETGSLPWYIGKLDLDEVMSERFKGMVDKKQEVIVTSNPIEKATKQMESWANDDSHGYDQQYRWGQRGDYDCSAAVIQAWENAGVPVKTKGATYTGNMRSVFLANGFKDVTSQVNLNTGSGLERGDVLLNYLNHTAMYVGNGQEVEASINERGTTTGGQPGDQTGREFLIRPYRNYPWNCVLRYVGTGASSPSVKPSTKPTTTAGVKVGVELPEIKIGDRGSAVAALQGILKYQEYNIGLLGVDGDFGGATNAAVKKFQQTHGLVVDGIVGEKTWAELMK